MALLTLSLNAQTLKATKNGVVVPPKAHTEKVAKKEAPTEKEVTPPDGYFRMGPSRASSTRVTPPYSNGFSSSEWDWWEVIDNNNNGSGDGKTWTYDSSNQRAVYAYHSSNAADDWLVTAPVHLVAGKTYKFYIDACRRSTSFMERLEVKLASSNTATALSAGTSIIAATDVESQSPNYTTFKNENVTVSTTGDYYFGIHAISIADRWELYVDNLLIDGDAALDHDLAISLSAPSLSGAGDAVIVTATVTNTGTSTEQAYTVTFTDGTTTINKTADASQSLEAGASTIFTAEFPTNDNAGGQTVNFTATVACANDADATNNTATASTALITLPPPENVQATGGNLSGTVTWETPSTFPTFPGSVAEGFEDTSMFPEFSLGGITASQHTGTIGNWTLYDATGSDVYGYQSITVPNLGDPMAWMVFAPGSSSLSQTLTDTQAAHNGDQMMASFCPESSTISSDHWLISPLLSGDAQTISFYARELTDQYGAETFEVLYSTTDNNPNNFILAESMSSSSTDWDQFSAQLPAGAKYFAIRHTSTDIFALFVDDISYEGMVSTPPASYNVYLDGELVGYVNSNDPLTYTFNNVMGEHQCAVSAVYPNGMESARVPATFTATSPDPELTAPANGSTVDLGLHYGLGVSTTINVSGNYLTQDLNVSVSGAGFSVSPASISAADANAGTAVVTVTYTGTDPNATGTLTIGNNEVSTTVNLTASYEYNTPVLTAPTDGSYVNMVINQGSTTSQTITVSGEYLTQDLTVSVAGDGFTVSPTTISAVDANAGTTITVTYNGTKPIASGTLTISSGEVSATVNLIASSTGGSTNYNINGIIRMGNLIIVDQFSESTASNAHPKTYKYVLKYAPGTADEKKSSPVTVDVKHTNSIVNGYYTAEDVEKDSTEYNTVIINRLAADVKMDLADNDIDIYYTRLQGKVNDIPREADKVKDNFDMLAKLQLISGEGGFYYSDAIPETHPQADPGEYHYTDKSNDIGTFAVDYKTYVPSIMTYGYDRRYFADDTLHNTYGAPIWKTGAGKVVIHNAIVERQTGQYASANWDAPADAEHPTSGVTAPASLVLLHNLLADGYLPSIKVANVEYEPYKFHVYVASPTGKLRGFKQVADNVDPALPGTHLANDPDFTNFYGPICIYSKDVSQTAAVALDNEGSMGSTLSIPKKEPNSTEWQGYPAFGALNSAIPGGGEQVNENDLKIYVRYYYRSKGNELPLMNGRRTLGNRDEETPMYNGTEGQYTPDSMTALYEVAGSGEVVSVTYVNPQGMQSDKPFSGVNIVITRYSDGSATTAKVVR